MRPNYVSIVWWSVLLAGVLPSQATQLNPTSLRAAAAYSARRGGLSMLVLDRNRPIFEDYENGFGRDGITSIFSGTKGFWCVAATAAQEDGILDLDEPVENTITEWQSMPDKQGIRIRDLLSFTAGIEPVFSLHGRSIPDRNGYSIRLRAVEPRGDSFMYGPSQLQIFSEVLKRKLARRGMTPEQYLTRRILRPLGIWYVDFREDVKGNPLLASGFKLTARQWSKLGTLILNDGKYRRHRFVDSDLLDECFVGTKANPMFGLGFWLNRSASDPDAREVDVENMLDIPWQRQSWRHTCLCKDAPRDLIAAIGSGYQRMYIIPSMDLVIVRQGSGVRFSDAQFLRLIFRE